MDNMVEKPVLPIGVVCEWTDLSARQVRYYEEEGLLHPQRTEGGQRRYNVRQVHELRLIAHLLDQGLKLDQIKVRLERRRSWRSGPNILTEGSDLARERDLPPSYRIGKQPPEIRSPAADTGVSRRPEPPASGAPGETLVSLYPVRRRPNQDFRRG